MKKQIAVLISGLLILTACGGSKKSDPTPSPQQASLVSPLLNELCNQGAPVSAGESSVTFTWNNGANADSYVLNVKNLLNGAIISQSTTGTSLAVTLAESTPFSWSVTSKSNKSSLTATTDTWKFYNSGPGAVNYAPFPAELVSPALNQSVSSTNGIVTLSWIVTDVDNDALTYNVCLDTSSNPGLLKSGVTASKYDVPVSSGTTYYWKIIATDAYGNSSESAIARFKVN